MKTLPRKYPRYSQLRTRGAEFNATIALSAAPGPRPNTWYKLQRAMPWKHFDPTQAKQ